MAILQPFVQPRSALRRLGNFLEAPVSAAPLAGFRVLFGLVMLASTIRFWANGWIEAQFLAPDYHFSYYGFGWVQSLGEPGMYVLFGVIALSALLIALGFLTRLSAIAFFLCFTYVELIDKTFYLNHYYFISLAAFLLCWVPAGRYFALDTLLWPQHRRACVPRWSVGIFRLQLGLLYFFAGAAKLNADWLLRAQPMRVWLPATSDLPLLGPWLDELWVAYAMSWAGALYDLTIAFFLIQHRTRPWAYLAVLAFHTMTAILFPRIGMFPYVMIAITLIFFSGPWHERQIARLRRLLPWRRPTLGPGSTWQLGAPVRPMVLGLLGLFFLWQLVWPMRYMLYEGNMFWTEHGYRFSWRVMLKQKTGTVLYNVKAPATGHSGIIYPSDYLSRAQVHEMGSRPGMVLQFAHFLEDTLQAQGYEHPQIRAECFAALNGRGSQYLIDPTVDLTQQPRGFGPKPWIEPLRSPTNTFAQWPGLLD
jgi:hypothetical protein